MVAASKFLDWPFKNVHCSQIPFHRNTTCFRSFFYDFYNFSVSGVRYYSPLVLAPLILKGTKMNKKELIDTIKFYIETIFSSSATGCMIFGLICLFRNLCGEFHLWTTFILPPYLATQLCWWFSKRSHRIFLMTTTQVALEALLRQQKSVFSYFLLNSKLLQALVFMASSTVIMHYKHLRVYNGFWFIQPDLVPAERNSNKEATKESIERNSNTKATKESMKMNTIWKTIFEYSKTYFIYGFGLDVLNSILRQFSSFKSKNLFQVLWSVVKGLRLNMTFFFLTYAGIYKLTLHYAQKYMTGTLSADLQHVVASFFGGASYLFVNKLTYNTYTLILAMQIFWQNYCRKATETKEKNSHSILHKIPFGNIILPLNITFIVYTYFYKIETMNSLGLTLVHALTGHKVQKLFDYIIKNDADAIIKDVSLRPLITAF